MREIPRSRCSLGMAMLVASPIFWRGSPTPLERRQYLTPEGQAASVDSYTLEANCRSLGLPTPARATFFTARVARAREARVPGTPVGPRDDSFQSRRRPRACAAPASHPGHARQIHPERAYIYFTARVKEISVAREILRKGVRGANCAPRSPPEADRSGRPISGFLESGGFRIPGIPEQFAGLHRSSRVPGIPEATAGPKTGASRMIVLPRASNRQEIEVMGQFPVIPFVGSWTTQMGSLEL